MKQDGKEGLNPEPGLQLRGHPPASAPQRGGWSLHQHLVVLLTMEIPRHGLSGGEGGCLLNQTPQV